MTRIAECQNEPAQLDMLAAQRYLYSKAKNVLLLQVIIILTVFSTSAFGIPLYSAMAPYAVLFSMATSLALIFFLNPWQRSLKNDAARIQEFFDCEVLELPWHELKTGARPEPELIVTAAESFKRRKNSQKHYDDLRNWYPTSVDQLPLHFARLVCQRTNCWWDSQLRLRYSRAMVATLCGLTIVVIIIAFINSLTTSHLFVSIFSPLLPLYIHGIYQFDEHRRAANKRANLQRYIENFWQLALSSRMSRNQMLKESRDLQDMIFDSRRSDPLVFDWIYKRLRGKHEEYMATGAEQYVKEALKIL